MDISHPLGGRNLQGNLQAVPAISVIIVSYNTAQLLEACLASVLGPQDVSLEVFVVDNASSDGSPTMVRERFPGLRLIVNTENGGFAVANNQALPYCNGRYTVLLNPDTTVEPSALRRLVTFMEDRPSVGLAGPRVLNPNGTPQRSVQFRYPGQRSGAPGLGRLPGRIAWVGGACMIIATDFLRSLGGFDEDFFLYCEDIDLCLRIRQYGKEIGLANDAVIYRYGGQSERNTPLEELARKGLRARYLFCRKHYRPKSIERVRRWDRIRAHCQLFLKQLLPAPDPRKLGCYRVMPEETSLARYYAPGYGQAVSYGSYLTTSR